MSAGSVLQVAGAIITLTGNPWIGIPLQIAGAYLNYLDQPDTFGPRLQDRTVQVSSYGAAIPVVFGSARIAGNVIWPKNFQVDEHPHSQSAKGGGPEQTTFTYSATFAVLFCMPPTTDGIAGFGRIWMNKKLVDDGAGHRDPCISVMRPYYGTETQDPDPLMVARDGSAQAYRGYAYILFEDLELTESGFGNRPPSIEAEVITNGTWSTPSDPCPIPTYAIGVDTGWSVVWCAAFSRWVGVGSSTSSCRVSTDRQIWADGGALPFTGSWRDIVSNSDGTVLIAFADSDNRCAVSLDGGATWMLQTMAHTWMGKHGCYEPITGRFILVTGVAGDHRSQYSNDNGSTWFEGGLLPAIDSWAGVESNGFGLVIAFTNNSTGVGAKSVNGGVDWTLITTPAEQWQTLKWFGPAGLFCLVGISGTHPAVTSSDGDIWANGDLTAGPAWQGLGASSSYLFVAGGTNHGAISTDGGQHWTDVSCMPTTGLSFSGWGCVASDGTDFLISGNGPNVALPATLSNNPTLVGAPVTLKSIVDTICTMEPSGLDAADLATTPLASTLVWGYTIGQQMSRRAAIEPLQRGFLFDIVESDHKLKGVMRGQAPAVTIPKDDRAAHEEGAEMPVDLAITRGSELELPWMLDVNYSDRSADYQLGAQYDRRITRNANDPVKLDLPIVFNGGEKPKQIAIVNLYLPWLVRTKFSFSTGLAYAQYEPTDVVMLPTDEVTYTARITSRSDQGNGIIKWEAELEDIAVYSQTGAVVASNFVPQTIADPGSTILALLDMPILRDADDGPGWYTAAAGSTTGWHGAQLYRSSDGGSTYPDAIAVFDSATVIGTALSALPDFTAGNIFDEGGSFSVVLNPGQTLTSCTEDQALNGVNAFVLGAAGRWEVGVFKNATLIAPSTYQLSGLLHGRRGTEWATGTHQVGDRFVLVNSAAWKRIAVGTGELGLPRLYKAPPFRTLLAAAASQSFTDMAVGLTPYASVDFAVARDGSNNATLSWRPRSRLGYGTLNAIVPVGETVESYSIDIYTDGSYATIADTITATGATLTINSDGTRSTDYTAAQQTAAGLTPGDPLHVRGYKLSGVVGRGYPMEAAA